MSGNSTERKGKFVNFFSYQKQYFDNYMYIGFFYPVCVYSLLYAYLLSLSFHFFL